MESVRYSRRRAWSRSGRNVSARAIGVGAEMAVRHGAQLALEPRGLRRFEPEETPRSQREDDPVKNAAFLRKLRCVVRLPGLGEELVVAAQAVERTADAVGLLAAFQEADLDGAAMNMRFQADLRLGKLVVAEHDHAGQGNVLLHKDKAKGLGTHV